MIYIKKCLSYMKKYKEHQYNDTNPKLEVFYMNMFNIKLLINNKYKFDI